MKKNLYLFSVLLIIVSLCYPKENDNSIILIKDPYTIEDINKLNKSFQSGKDQALETLIAISKDKNQILNVRIAALEILSKSDHPMLKTALNEIISKPEFIEFEILSKTIEILLSFEDLESSDSFIQALKNSENQIMNLRETLVEAIGENNHEDKVLALVDLYDISLSNHQRMNELLTVTLGNINDDRAIPILMNIAQNDQIDLRIRNRAIEILSRKNAPELVDFFINMLGTPGSNDQMLNFINNSMGIVEKDRLMLALLESYQVGKNRYYAVLHSIMESLENYSSPDIKPVFIEVAKNDGYPRVLRIKAINSLANFEDKKVLTELMPMLEDKNNYDLYYEIMNLAKSLDAEKDFHNHFNSSGLKAMNKQ